ncbi:MAG: hypothetical protein LPK02_01055 [Rhodobacterales bacterium]|nr:hypothetical protein [Rhodobacterales bacterium]MDX5411622.1 hypothetical protein [Rhodobacterales bacterium]
MRLTLKTGLMGGALLAMAACAAPSDRYGQAQADAARGAQTVPDQTGVTVTGSARVGVTRTIN